MPLIQITPHDILHQRMRLALEEINACDLDEDFPELRRLALARVSEVVRDAAQHGYRDQELYFDVVSDAEGLADFQAEK